MRSVLLHHIFEQPAEGQSESGPTVDLWQHLIDLRLNGHHHPGTCGPVKYLLITDPVSNDLLKADILAAFCLQAFN
jgi:hypothetical protein